MAVQHEIKSQLAKLLATEDLVVEHKQVETASFNVETRVLVLPLWEKASNSIYDMLVGHEVGHALFTPNDDWFLKTDVPNGAKMFVRSPLQTKMEPDFDTGNIRFKARERYSFGFSDWRGYFGASGSS